MKPKSNRASEPAPNTVADGGGENVNEQVDALESPGIIKRMLAQIEVVYSNSMIEAWWKSLKHQWLFLNKLDKMAAVAFYVKQHNSVIPHSALGGLTPDEVCFETGAGVPEKLAEAWQRAREARLAANRAKSCTPCRQERG